MAHIWHIVSPVWNKDDLGELDRIRQDIRPDLDLPQFIFALLRTGNYCLVSTSGGKTYETD